jgi:hypothetical protein
MHIIYRMAIKGKSGAKVDMAMQDSSCSGEILITRCAPHE